MEAKKTFQEALEKYQLKLQKVAALMKKHYQDDFVNNHLQNLLDKVLDYYAEQGSFPNLRNNYTHIIQIDPEIFKGNEYFNSFIDTDIVLGRGFPDNKKIIIDFLTKNDCVYARYSVY